MFELVEESLDAVSKFVSLFVVRDVDLSVPLGRDDHFDFCRLDDLAEVIGVISLVDDHAACSLPLQQVSCGGTVVGFTASEDETQWSAFGVGEGMDFRG